MGKAVFFVKDVLLISNISYNTDSCLIAQEEHIICGLKILQREGFKLIVVTNQPRADFGSFTQKNIEGLGKRTREFLENKNIQIDGFYRVAEQIDIELSESWIIGDRLNDVETGNRLGCRTILIDNGNEKEWDINEKRVPDLIVRSLHEAASLLLVADELLLPKDMVSMLGFS